MVVSEYTGGGFGSKITGAISLVIPVLLAKKANAPVMMRISREEEHYIGRGRPGVRGRMKVGFAKDGRITALDMFSVSDNGPFERQGDCNNTGVIASLAYQPQAMRFRGISVLTNTPPRGPQSQPGGTQSHMLMEPVISKAARQARDRSGGDSPHQRAVGQGAVRPAWGSEEGNGSTSRARSSRRRSTRAPTSSSGTSARRRAASANGIEGARRRRRGEHLQRRLQSGYDGLFVIKPDGRLYIQSGIGNHGTGSVSDCHRVSAEILGVPWEKVVVDLGRHVEEPAVDVQQRRQPDDPRDDARGPRGRDGREEETAGDRGQGSRRPPGRLRGRQRARLPQGRRCRHDPGEGGAARDRSRRRYDGHELPKDINKFTTASATALAGQGLMGVAKDNYPRDGQSRSFVAGFAEVEIDVETGKYHILDYLAVADVGTVIHPRSARRADSRPLDARHRSRDRPEVGLRPAVRRGAGAAVPSQPAADDSRCAGSRWRGRRWTSRIRKRRSVRAASASRRSAPAPARCSTRSATRWATTSSSAPRSRST